MKYLGSYGNAANTVVFPLTVVALAIAITLTLISSNFFGVVVTLKIAAEFI